MRTSSLRAAFAPNRALSAGALRLIIAVQVGVALAVWWSSPSPILPSPGEVARALGQLWFQEGLGRELGTSLTVNLEALALTLVISLGLSYLTVVPFFRPLAAAASKGRFLGLIGLTFAFTLTLGGGRPLKVALLVFGMTVFFVTSMADVVAAIPKEALRQNAAIGWMMLTMVEGISRSEGGIGAMLLNQNKHFRLAEVFAIQLLILLVGVLQDYGIGVLRRVLFPYADLRLERQ